MASEVLNDVYMVEVPIGGQRAAGSVESTLLYLIREEEGFVLVDAGWAAEPSLAALESQLREVGVRFTDIGWMVVTHFHPDHSGLARRIREMSGARLVMHRLDSLSGVVTRITEGLNEEREWLAQQGYPEAELELFFRSPRPLSRIPRLDPDLPVEGGEQVGGSGAALSILWTPGHTPGHICVYDAKRRVLFSGDHVLPNITSNISLSPFTGPNPLSDYLDSLERLRPVEAELVLPAHEMPFQGLQGRLAELRRHHERRLQEVHDLLTTGPRTAFQLATQMKWGGDPWEQPFAFPRYLALAEAMAHVRFLVEQGLAYEVRENGVARYETVP